MWILQQGQKEPPKMLPKSHRCTYVGFDDRSKSVLYYYAETRKILKSRNFCFLTPPKQNPPPEEIEVAPDLLCEGEAPGGNTRVSGDLISPSDELPHRLRTSIPIFCIFQPSLLH